MRTTLEDIAGRKVLLVANTGGHLHQLTKLVHQLGVSPDSEWVTFDTPQSRSLLDGQTVHYVPYVAPRDWRNILRAWWQTRRLRRDFEGAVSTGAGLALAVLPAMLLKNRRVVFIESISRVHGPSLSGRILARLPRIGLYAQHGWASDPWKLGPSALSSYQADEPAQDAELPQPRTIFVTLGTIKPYRFDRMVDLVKGYVESHPGTQVRWQLGVTDRDDLPGEVFTEMRSAQFKESIEWADLVVAHAGVGISMNILDAGKIPVLLAREVERGEHVDAHQRQIFDYLVERGLAADAEQVFAHPEQLPRVAATTVQASALPRRIVRSSDGGEQPQVASSNPSLLTMSDGLRDRLRPMHRRIAGALPLYWRRQYLFVTATGRSGNFTHPRTLGEKLNWRILNDRRPLLVPACDKLQMKEMARERVSDPQRLRIPETWWTGTDVDDIPEELLGREAVLKPNDGSGEVVFLPAPRDEVREKTRGWLTGEQSERLGEWGYGQAEHVMLLEEKIPVDGDLPDYKFSVFDGRVLSMEVHTDRFGKHRCTYFDENAKRLDVETSYLPSSDDIALPPEVDTLYELAAELGAGWDYIRVDLYLVDGQVWFGEFTPYPQGGLGKYLPASYDRWLGDQWQLPSLDEVRG